MKFKTDENLPVEVSQILNRFGHEAHTVHDEGLQGGKDPHILSVCRQEKRVLVTLDLDFSDIRAYPPGEHSGIIVFRLKQQDKVFLLEMVHRLCSLLPKDGLERSLWIVDEKKIRIRQ